MKKIAVGVLVFLLGAVIASASLVVYVIHWEQNETEWLEIRTYGQSGDVYIEFESSFREVHTFHLPAEFAGVLSAQIIQAAKDTSNETTVSNE